MFPGRYIRWKENFVEARRDHVEILQSKFDLPEAEWVYHEGREMFPVHSIFREAHVDGLISGPDYCVGDQQRKLRTLVPLFSIHYWRHDRNTPIGAG